eukprot:TRINITY_DN1112_c0_g1_i12.p1 TRINITY_DN1112_c0_g1~~TRINITY_DN1112_c0_g1_i12.p1  ORF type:complete len:300 (+),score=44.09 TRINITY_DN1112_c0_g1_i12:1816-2715(+)
MVVKSLAGMAMAVLTKYKPEQLYSLPVELMHLLEHVEGFATIPWRDGVSISCFPTNHAGKVYQGDNRYLLSSILASMPDVTSSTFVTFSHVKKSGGMVMKGQKACAHVKYFAEVPDKRNPAQTSMVLRQAPVWHISQTTGLKQQEVVPQFAVTEAFDAVSFTAAVSRMLTEAKLLVTGGASTAVVNGNNIQICGQFPPVSGSDAIELLDLLMKRHIAQITQPKNAAKRRKVPEENKLHSNVVIVAQLALKMIMGTHYGFLTKEQIATTRIHSCIFMSRCPKWIEDGTKLAYELIDKMYE